MRGTAAAALLVLVAACSGSPARTTTSSAPSSPAVLTTSSPAEPTPAVSASQGTPAGPPGFRPLSATFVSMRTGWFLGADGCETAACTRLLVTRDGGRTFAELAAPPRVGQVRFANLRDGWGFGGGLSQEAGLWRTTDGGRHWHQVLRGRAVTSLDVSRGVAWAIVLGPDGTGPQLFRGSTRDDRLLHVTDLPNRSGYVVASHGVAYAVGQHGASPLAPSLTLVDGSGPHRRRLPPCPPDSFDVVLTASSATALDAVCPSEPSAGQQPKTAFVSEDGAQTWRRLPDPPSSGYTADPGQLAATSDALLLTGDRNGVVRERGTGRWQLVLAAPDDDTGFFFVGMTDDEHGVVLGLHEAWRTSDGGDHWRQLAFPARH